MTVDISDRRNGEEDAQKLGKLAEEVIGAVLTCDRVTLRVNVGLTLVDDEEIRKINLQFREIDSATDVLSFPMTAYNIKTAPRSRMLPDIDPETDELVLGDIVVSVERARAQAAEYGHSFEREFGYLVAHGMLHLLGYDHARDADADLMRSMEVKALSSLSLKR